VVDVSGDGHVPDLIRLVHQLLTLLYDFAPSAHYAPRFPKHRQKGSALAVPATDARVNAHSA
jgi:hypothetical protein